MSAMDIMREVLDDMPKREETNKEICERLCEETLNPKPEHKFRDAVDRWKRAAQEAQRVVEAGASEHLMWIILKRHLENVVGWYAITELGRQAGEEGYRLCVRYWTDLAGLAEGPEN